MSIQDLISRIETAKSNLEGLKDQVPRDQSSASKIHGWEPSVDRPGFAFIETESGGVKATAGLMSTEDPNGIFRQKGLSGEVEGTVITDLHGGTGNPRDGIKAGVGVYEANLDIAAAAEFYGAPLPDEANVANLEFKAAAASAEASVGKDGLTAGATASLVEGGFTVGSSSAENEQDETVRLVGVAGQGYAARLHWDDADSDGFREFGLGGDYSFLSADIKTEDPLRTLLSGGNTSGGVGGNLIMDPILPEGNLTESVANKFGLSIKDENAPNA
jgi:hypothetical protein